MLNCITHMTIIVGDHLCDKCKLSNELSVCHKLLSILWLVERVCLLTKLCHVYQFVPHTSSSRQSVSILLTILRPFPFPPPWSDGCPSKDLKLSKIALSFRSPVRNFFRRIFSHDVPFHIVRPRDSFCVRFFPPRQLFTCSSWNWWFEHLFFLNDIFVRFAFTLSTSQVQVVKKWCWFSKIDQVHQFLPHTTQILPSSSHFLCHPRIPIRIILVFDAPTGHLGLNRTFSKCLSLQEASKWVSVHVTIERNYGIFNVWPWFRPFVSWKTCPHIRTFWLWNCEQFWSVLHLDLSVGRYCVSCLSVAVW